MREVGYSDDNATGKAIEDFFTFINRKNEVWREWFKNRTDENKEKWKRLSKAAKKEYAQKQACNKFVKELETDFKSNKKIFYSMLKNKTKPRDKNNKILNNNGK